MFRKLFFLSFCCLYYHAFPQTTFEQKPSTQLDKFISLVKMSTKDSVVYYFNKASAIAKKEKNIEAQTQLYTYLIQRLFVGGEHDKTVSYFLKAVREFEKLKPYDERVSLYYEGSGVYSKNSDFKDALKFINQGIRDAKFIKSDLLIADGYNRLGVVLEREKLLDSAMVYYQKSLKINESINEPLGTSYSLDNIAGIYGAKNQSLKALPYQKRSLNIRKKLNDRFGLSIALINISESFNNLNQLDSAIKYAKQSLEISTDIKFLDLEQYTLNHLSDIYKKKGDFEKALNYKNEGMILKDSIYNKTKSQQIQELTAKYETEKKEKKIKELNQQAQIKDLEISRKNNQLVFGLILFITALIIIWLYLNRKKIQTKIEIQNEIIKQQDLATKAILDAEDKERRRIAGDLHDGVGQLLSAALMNLNGLKNMGLKVSEKQRITLEKSLALISESYDEMRSLSHQMMPNALIKSGLASAVREFLSKIDENQLKINLNLSGFHEKLEQKTETVIYRVIQEAVNNVIKHAEAKSLSIQLHQDKDGISLTIEDDGKGFDLKRKENGIGLEQMKSRIGLLNGDLEIDSRLGKGTLLQISIPST